MSLMLAMLGLTLSGCSQGPQGVPPITLEHAQQLEATDYKTAVVEYNAVRNEFNGKNDEAAAQALLRAAQFAADPNRYGTPAQLRIAPGSTSAEDRQRLEDARQEGDVAARAALKQMEQHYSDTKTYKDANVPVLLAAVEKSIDDRNSKMTSYKIVDGLVRLTGSHPDFSYWFALVLIAVFIKAITFPLLLKTYKSQREMQKIQPVLKEIQTKYKGDQAEIQTRTMAAYKEHGVNPFASCLPSLIQIPIFMLMFRLIQAYEIHFTHGHFLWITPSVAHSAIGQRLGLASDLAHLDMPILILYAASMYISMKLAPSPDPQMAAQQRQMSVMMTGMMIFWFIQTRWSSAFLLYYLVQNILSTWQQYVYIYKPNKLKGLDASVTYPSASSSSGSGSSGNARSPKPSPGVHDVTFTDKKTGDTDLSRAGTPANRPRPKRKTRR